MPLIHTIKHVYLNMVAAASFPEGVKKNHNNESIKTFEINHNYSGDTVSTTEHTI